jgi:ribose transport system substrate-binding protein
MLGSVAFFPERYGDDLIRVSLDILNHRPVPPAVFVEHKLVTPATVEHFYPNDGLIQLSTLGRNGEQAQARAAS